MKITDFDISNHSIFLSTNSISPPTGSVETPSAWAGHVPFAYFVVSLLKPKILVELGVYTGISYNAFCQAVKELGLDTQCYGVDTWQGDEHTGIYREEIYDRINSYHQAHYPFFSTLLKQTFDQALESFSEESIDLLHIDGCHTYEAVKHDFVTWLPKMKKDGVVIFHDICERTGDFGVWQLWEELRANYPTIEMAHSHGLGALFLGYRNAEVEQFVRQFKEEAFLRLLFERIGIALAENRELNEQKKNLNEAVNKHILEVDQRNQEFIAQARELDQRNQEFIAQAWELDHRNREFIAQAWELNQKNQELISQSRELELKNQELIARDREFDRISEEFSEQGGELELMSQELYAHARELEQLSRLFNEVINSGSWKITAPLRTIGQWARKVVKYPLQARVIMEKVIISLRDVGLINTLKKINRYRKNIKLEDFEHWLEQNSLTREDYKNIYKNLQELPYQPLISIILPVYNVDEKWLRICLDSVKSQLYTNWELCIADDASTKPHVKRVLEEYRKRNERIKVIYRQKNGHISAASNSALELATGEYIALLDHDDELTSNALYEIVLLLNKHPEADMIYSDYARIDEDGRRHSPYFKPEWSPDTFLCQMYICHLSVYRKTLVREIGGFREGFEGSQDYDLVLRLTEKTKYIYHIPKVLYYWRTIYQSVAGNPKAKEYAFTASFKALGEALRRRGEGGMVNKVPNCPGTYVVNYALKSKPPISIIISAGGEPAALQSCITALHERTDYDNYELIIVDSSIKNNVEQEYYIGNSYFDENKLSVISSNRFVNYPAKVNHAVSVAKGELVVLLSDEIEILTSDWLSIMAGQAMRDSIGAVGAKIFYPNDTVQHAGIILGIGGAIGHSHRYVNKKNNGYFGRLIINSNYAAVSGACMMIKKRLYIDIGGLDEGFAAAYSDVDMCLKLISKGYYNVILPDVQMYIHENKKELRDELERLSHRDLKLLKERWGDLLNNDPFYSPNLTLKREDFSINLS